MIAVFLAVCFLIGTNALQFKNGAYEDLIFQIEDDVPFENCKEVLANLEVGFFIVTSHC